MEINQEDKGLVKKQEKLLSLLSQTTTSFIDVNGENFAEKVKGALSQFGQLLSVDRAYVIEYRISEGLGSTIYEWCAEGIESFIDEFQEVPEEAISARMDGHGIEQSLCITDAKEQITIPMINKGKCYGFVGFDSVRKHQIYTKCEQNVVYSFSAILLSAIVKMKMERDLHKSEERYRSITAVSNTGVWEYYHDKDDLLCSPEYFTMLGYSSDEFGINGSNLKQSWIDLLHPEDQKTAVAEFTNYVTEGVTENATEYAKKLYDNQYRMKRKDGSWTWIWSRGQTLLDDKGKKTNLTVGTHIDVTENKRTEYVLKDKTIFLDTLLESIQEGIAVIDKDFTLQYTNSTLQKWNIDKSLLVGEKCFKALRGKVEKCDLCPAKRCFDTKKPQKQELIHYTSEGEKCVEVFAYPLVNSQNPNDIDGVVEFIRDITEQKQVEETLFRQMLFQKMVAEISSDFLTTNRTNLNQKINAMLKKTGKFFGVDRAYLFFFSEDGSTMTNTHEWCEEGVQAQLETLQDIQIDAIPWWGNQIMRGKIISIADVDHLPEEASIEKVEFKRQQIQSLLTVPIKKNDRYIGFFGFDAVQSKVIWQDRHSDNLNVLANVLSDAMVKVEVEEAIEKNAYYDYLTNLPNRRLFMELGEQEAISAKRDNEELALLFIDLDKFKLINDTYGHDAGDIVLIEVAKRIKGIVRRSDISCRIGGDEFIVLLKDIKDRVSTVDITEKLIHCIVQPIQIEKNIQVEVGLSIGISFFPVDDDNFEELIKKADKAMYKAKKVEQPSYHLYSETNN